jgi:hypothetical protein
MIAPVAARGYNTTLHEIECCAFEATLTVEVSDIQQYSKSCDLTITVVLIDHYIIHYTQQWCIHNLSDTPTYKL